MAAILAERGEILSTDFRAELDLPRTSLWRLLQPLLKWGQAITLGKGRATRYRWVRVANSEVWSKSGRALTADERRVLALVAELGSVRRRDLVERLGLSVRTASRVLLRLTALSMLERAPSANRYLARQRVELSVLAAGTNRRDSVKARS